MVKNLSKIKILIKIFNVFFKIGLFTFGGGFAMIPLIEKEIVDNNGWIERDEIIDIFAISQCIPGSIAINTASLIGYKISNVSGLITATIAVLMPAFFTILCIANFFSKFNNLPIAKSVFFGIRSCVVALICIAGINVTKSSIKDKLSILLIVFTVLIVEFLKISPIIPIIISIIPGIIIFKYFPEKKNKLISGDK